MAYVPIESPRRSKTRCRHPTISLPVAQPRLQPKPKQTRPRTFRTDPLQPSLSKEANRVTCPPPLPQMSALRGVGQGGQGPPLSIPTGPEAIAVLAVITTSACLPKTSVTTALRVLTATLMRKSRVAETTILSSMTMSGPRIMNSKRHGNYYCNNYVKTSKYSLRIPSTMSHQNINRRPRNANANAPGPQNGSPNQRTSSTN